VEQERINLNKGKRPILRDLYARPGIGAKKSKGTLECHLNGFRYSTVKNEVIDLAFSNIKYAFFQPCEKEIIAAVHFRLNEPIMVGKKKTEDIQFYSEGGVIAEDVVGRGRGEDSDDEEKQK
jgi:nucleosome binding factor SPN SPT16 subunit